MFRTPVTRLVQAMVGGAAKTKMAQARARRPPTALRSGSFQSLRMPGSLMARAAVRTVVGSQKAMWGPRGKREVSIARQSRGSR